MTTKRSPLLPLLGLLLLLAPWTPARAAERLPLITGSFEPYTGEDLPEGGPLVRLVRAVVAEMGMEAEIQYYPWPRAELLLQNGIAFAAFPYGKTRARAAEFDFSDNLLHTRTVFFHLKNQVTITDYKNLKELRPYRVGGNYGYSYLPLFLEAGLDYGKVSRQEQLILMLAAHRFDLVAVDQAAGWMYIRQHFPDRLHDFATLATPIETDPEDMANRLMISRSYPGHEQLAQAFDAALDRLRGSGQHGRITGVLFEGM